MTSEEQQRLGFLRTHECVPGPYITAYYGLQWPLTAETERVIKQYHKALRKPVQCPVGSMSRYELEGFLVREHLLTRKWMAAKLGMTAASLDKLLVKLDDLGMATGRYVVYPEFVAESLSEDLVRHVPGLKFRLFRDHNAFCGRLHAELNNTIGLTVEPMFCATSERLKEDPARYAMHFDCLTLQPVSTKHSAWLDFGKPIRLPPDRCSKLFYVQNRTTLKPLSAGTTEPDGLDQYESFAAGGHNG